MTMNYRDLLKSLLPYGAYSDDSASLHETDLAVNAGSLDGAQANADGLYGEVFPDSTSALLDRWERVYGLKQADRPLYLRTQILMAAINASRGLSIAHLQAALYRFFGYNVAVTDYMAFRADDPACLTDGDKYALEADYVFQFDVTIDNALITTAGYDQDVIADVVYKWKPAHTVAYIHFGIGFFCDSPLSLTDTTLLAV